MARDVSDGLLWHLPPHEEAPAIDLHAVWNPRTRMYRPEALFLARLLEAIETTPIEDRTYLWTCPSTARSDRSI
ncbi:MAG: hypothetical protein ACLFPZ_03030 [Rhodosalinus sp.]